MAALPDWAAPGRGPDLRPAHGRGRPGKLARKGLGQIVRSTATLLGSLEDEGGGFLRTFDARAKIAGFLLVIVACTLAKRPESLALVVAGSWLLAVAAKLDARRFLLALSVVPLFTAALALPACLNVVTDGPPLWVLLRYPAGSFGPWRWPENLTVTVSGLFVAARFFLRSTACVSLAAVLTASTPTPELLRGLRGLGVPASFVMAGAMMVRYLVLLLSGAEEVHMAKLSRSLTGVDVGREQAWAAASLGETFRRSRALAEEVTHAMISRGYAGEAKTLSTPALRLRDALFFGACVAAAALLGLKG